MTWAHPLLLAAAPLAALAAWWLARGLGAAPSAPMLPNVRRRWADRRGVHPLHGAGRAHARGLLMALAFAAGLGALARPQGDAMPLPAVSHARDVMIALDLSRSMLAGDVAPTRLARARLLLEALLDTLRDERVGLTLFAGTAFVQSPLSADHEVLRTLLADLTSDYLPQGGTDFGAMLRAAREAFEAAGDGDRTLIVLSDGEAHDPAWTTELAALRAAGVRVIALGIGTPAGAPLPDLADARGAPVHSRLDPRTLQELAQATGGTYRDAATWVDIGALIEATVARGAGTAVSESTQPRRAELFQWLLAPALLLMLLAYWRELPIPPLARPLPARRPAPPRGTAPAMATAALALLAWLPPSQASAAAAADPPPGSAAAASPIDLAATIAELSAQPALDAADHARLAADTIGFVAQPGAPRDGIIDDALAAVERGGRLDPAAADWAELRARLEALRTPPASPEQPPPAQDQETAADAATQPTAQDDGTAHNGAPQSTSDDTGSEQRNGQRSDESSAERRSAGEHDRDSDASDAEHSADQSDARPATGGSNAADASEPGDRNDDETDEAADAPRPPDAPALADGQPADAPASGAPADAPAPQRLVGGGALDPAALPQDPAAADVQARVAQITRADRPATLFERMNRAEGRPRHSGGKEW